MLKLNPNKEFVKNMKKSIEKNKFHCPCQIIKNEDSICAPAILGYPDLIMEDEVCGYSKKNRYGQNCCCNLYIAEGDDI
jgi:hypothetical protein